MARRATKPSSGNTKKHRAVKAVNVAQKLQPLVSILILNYNNLDIIAECIDSVLQLSYPRVEVFVIDDCSSDGSPEFIEERYKQKVTVLKKLYNSGIGTSRNLGIQKSSGEIILFLDSDVKVTPTFLDRSVELLAYDASIGIVAAKLKAASNPAVLDQAGGNYFRFGVAKDRGRGEPADKYNDEAEVFYAGGAAQLIRRSVIEKIGMYDVTTATFGCEDIDMCWRARMDGYKTVYNPLALGWHGYHKTVEKLPKDRVIYTTVRANIKMLIKDYGRFNLAVWLPAALVASLVDIVLFKPRRAKLRAWWWNLANLRATLRERKQVQAARIVPDSVILPYFSKGIFAMLINKLRTTKPGVEQVRPT